MREGWRFIARYAAATSGDSISIYRIASSLIQLVRFRRHDEIVAMQAPDLVRPPCDRRPAPFGQQRRVMPLFLCKFANLLREFQRLRKIGDRKDASQAFDSIELHDVPVRDLALKFG